ncbi:serine hydrolase domain-containing protein [Arachidicoccus terrestris]|uniref:serine hydrolase domain-containing protein n=1 Tax=Arachidicoccus terrestris TaxID=2875539 RepID=UPI001CC5FA59|nr:serine hydrolase domain-containing protein [Arachidicoccus terrestris]UAY55658.1 beta-lactamase family protein [Arachidicoccus terrestris]
MRKGPIILASLLAVCILGAKAQGLKGKVARLDAYFSAKAAQHAFNGVILVAEGPNIIYQKAFGYADFGTGRLNTAHSRFPIASITKLLTATAVLQLQDRGLLNIEDPVQKYLPDFPYPCVTIQQLLTHTSGLPGWDDVFAQVAKKYLDSIFTNADVVSQYAKAHANLAFKPGTAHIYNNVNSVFAALIIKKVSGISYESYMQKNIFEPAGMKDTFIPKITFYNYDSIEKKNLSRLYVTHLFNDQKEAADTMRDTKKYWHRYNFRGFGEIVTTAYDLFLFNQALLNGKLLKPETLKASQTAIHLTGGQPTRMGLGWQVEQDSVLGKIAGHGGGITGLSTGVLYQFHKQRLAVVLDNTQRSAEDMEVDALMIMAGRKLKIPGRSIANIFGLALVNSGSMAARDSLERYKKNPAYDLSENQFNHLGYDLMRSGKLNEALVTFKINAMLFPQSYNAFDSYGEALMQAGQKNEALQMYQRSVELNPGNTNGKRMIKELTN